jgi:hypothetical protein
VEPRAVRRRRGRELRGRRRHRGRRGGRRDDRRSAGTSTSRPGRLIRSSQSSARCRSARRRLWSADWTEPRLVVPRRPVRRDDDGRHRACPGHDRYPHRKQVLPHRAFLTGQEATLARPWPTVSKSS